MTERIELREAAWVVVLGDPYDGGVSLIGPFANPVEATAHADGLDCSDAWQVVPVFPPADQAMRRRK